MTDRNQEASSNDSVRPGEGPARAEYYHRPGGFDLDGGGRLDELTICYETWGSLAANRDNCVLICHALSGDSHVARHDAADAPGWWDLMVGPGQPVDTDRYFVVCSNVIGGCRGSTGPASRDPATGRRYGADFPSLTVADMVRAQALLLDHLGIDSVLCVIGGSLGGFQSLAWAAQYPSRTAGCVALAAAPRLSSQAIAFDVVGRNAITHDPRFAAGQYYDAGPPASGLAIARMLAHITYLSRESMGERFDPIRAAPRDVATAFESKFSVGSYLAYQGHKFVERFDANSYVTLTLAMDSYDLGGDTAAIRDTFASSDCRFLIASFSSDWLYPPGQSRAIVDALLSGGKRVSYCNVQSDCGHDGFLLPDDAAVYGGLVKGFLSDLSAHPSAGAPTAPPSATRATRIFHGQRLDYELVLEMVPHGASVLDLGCGDGELLSLLRSRGHRRVVGVELDERAIVACVARGHDVIQADLDAGLAAFSDASFDVALLSQTLQSIEDVSTMLDELVRVARSAIVSFPNFAHRPLREMFFREGRIPKSEGPYGFEWYDSPNRRFPSIADFEDLCSKKEIRIEARRYIDTTTGEDVVADPNLHADIAIVAISR